ncbi:hypothetical protein TanjilG_16563 [Lupinus angustifolius]|uniref:Uncharacterized protein n=1 Tax=Lupinus angustifolius TaxID=3871 RepID=A0A1J7GUE9_LUPAN|nr:PREDICTED: uncharacterized protein LOC109332886 isoform X1 [Lupinus angustifolius]OIV93712.1 hypothetical protein TanjilG_16563 [Lupinus angustifolius]
MIAEVIVQLCILILSLFIILFIYNLLHQSTHTKSRTRSRTRTNQPNRHLAQSSRHLSRATATTRSTSQRAKAALSEADTALSISPRDPSAHIHRAKALHLLGHPAAALRSLDAALSLPASKTLTETERAEALVKRAEVKVEVNRRRRMESAVKDLEEAVGMNGGKRIEKEALCLLGKCYEWKGMKEEAKQVFKKLLHLQPDSVEASNGLHRLPYS